MNLNFIKQVCDTASQEVKDSTDDRWESFSLDEDGQEVVYYGSTKALNEELEDSLSDIDAPYAVHFYSNYSMETENIPFNTFEEAEAYANSL